ncbi:MAG: N-6 DNA methylase [Candidatus Eisenbacteria bacterium]|nr:N-6 DNA methylase [Candidatus Eisenbacteria bacterium]
MSSVPSIPSERKRLGAWYTPISIVRPLVEWAVRPGDSSVLDPAIGDGGFLVAAAARLRALAGSGSEGQLYGFDVNARAVAHASAALTQEPGRRIEAHLRRCDFFEVNPPAAGSSVMSPVDAVVGNPPYIRYQSFAGEVRVRALRRAREAGASLTRLSSSWAAFVIHATAFLRPGGRLALVLPEELVHSSYSADVRAFLRRTFQVVSLISFENHLFPESQERIVLLMADGKDSPRSGELRLVAMRHPDDIDDLPSTLGQAEAFSPCESPEKWEPGFHDRASRELDRLREVQSFVPLSALGKAGIGYVTGANEYFILSRAEANRRRVPSDLLAPTVMSARQIPGVVLTSQDMRESEGRGVRCLLWDGRGAYRKSLAAYIQEGEALGIHKRYKCRVRNPWYRVPGIIVPHAFLTYMSDVIPRMVLNRGRATCTNTLLAIRLPGIRPNARADFVASFYNSATILSAERVGRRYGGGVLKLEPSEADRLLVPNLSVVSRRPELRALLREIDPLVRSRRYDEALELGDRIVLERACGFSIVQVKQLRDSLQRRRALRHGAAISPRSQSGDFQTDLLDDAAGAL